FRARILVFGGHRVVPLFLGEVVGCCFKNIMDGDLGLVVQFHEGAICATVCRDGVICHPVTVHVPIQIFSRFRGCGCHVSPSKMCRVHWGLTALTTYCRWVELAAPTPRLTPGLLAPTGQQVAGPIVA